jgi:hypothetical protein
MMSLRLILALVSALLGRLVQAMGICTRTTRAKIPVYGPSGPWTRRHVAAITPPRKHRHAEPARRPAPVRAPPHILAVLAAAPDVEPGLVPSKVLLTQSAHPTVLPVGESVETQDAPAPVRRRRHTPRTWLFGLTLRLSRGCRAVAEWLVFDSPPPIGIPEEALMRRTPLAMTCSALSPQAS